MYTSHETIIAQCPNEKCNNRIIIDKKFYPGGVNDYGSFEVKCNECQEQFIIEVGRDVDASSIESGATLIRKIYRD